MTFVLSSCKNSDSSSTGDVMFWMDESNPWITRVEFRNSIKSITKYYYTTPSSCGASGCATFNDIPKGTYTYYAENSYYYWSGTVTVSKNTCTKMRLYAKKGEMKDKLDNVMESAPAELGTTDDYLE